ncbi:hypothetical protein A9P18_22055 [Klebsiella pneumoniae]|nr:hypothetical protein [Klebsiella pneumoniae]
MTSKLTRDIIQSEIADFFAGVSKIHTELGGPNTVEEAQNQLTERVLACLPEVDGEPAEKHIGSKNALDAIVSFIKSKGNPTVKCYEEVSEQLFKDNCHGIHSHVIEYILKLGEELEDLRAEQDEIQSAPVATTETISFDEWSRKCALQITLCYPDFREKAQYIWDSARETQQPAPVVPDEIKHRIGGLDWGWEGEFNRGWNACRAAMLAAAPQEVKGE